MRARSLVVAASSLLALAAQATEPDVVARALRDELARSMERLQLESLEKPYFIAYRVQERNAVSASATFGALLGRSEVKSRYLSVELRVGKPALDNTGFVGATLGGVSGVGAGVLPREDDYTELRRQIWLATDRAYKRALEDLARKRAVLQNRQRSDETPDFAAEPPATYADATPPAELPPVARLEALARALSAPFREMPAVHNSRVQVTMADVLARYVNSAGTSYSLRTPLASVQVNGATQAGDGMALEDYYVSYGRAFEDLPSQAELLARVRELGARLAQLREAPVLDRYSGPVLFEDQAAAEVFQQGLASRLPASRRPVFENEMMGRALGEENPLLEKLGARVLPESMSLVDDPRLREAAGKKLLGGYAIDEEGVRPSRTTVVDKGILKTLLTTCSPVRGIARSTGNRRGAASAPSNLILVDEKGLAPDAVRAELLKRVKERGKDYGIVVRRLGHPFYTLSRETGMTFVMTGSGGRQVPISGTILAYKVYPDGREELVRNLEISGLVPTTFKEIVASSRDAGVYTVAFDYRNSLSQAGPVRTGMLPGDSAPPVVSLVVPSLLFDDLTLLKPTREVPKPPVMKHPFFDK
jgi:predicted Zn-dependent protease